MLEVQGNSVIFYAFYTQDGAGDTGLTVTVTVYEITRDGTKTEIVSDAAVTEIGDGLYRYLLAGASVDAAAEYVAVFHTADTDTDQQDMPAMWVIDRANLEDIDDILTDTGTDGVVLKAAGLAADAVTEIQSGLALETTLNAVKAKTDLITTGTAITVVSQVKGSTITVLRGDTLHAQITGLGSLADCVKLWFTVKRDYVDADTAAIIQIEKTAGLKYLNGATGTPANGSLTINDEATGDITIALDEVETAKLSPGKYYYDVQIVRTAGTVSTLTEGVFNVSADVTRATA